MKSTPSLKTALLTLALTAAMHLLAGQTIKPNDFTLNIDNPYFPLVPGTTFVYEGTTDRSPATDLFQVTSRTKVILGVKCREILDQAYINGVLEETTLDWFAQDKDGNVWYFGEDTKELDPNGNVTSTEGSWQAGVDGAQPGIIMEAHPRVGDRYQQEFASGIAEDMAQVLRLKDDQVCVRAGCF